MKTATPASWPNRNRTPSRAAKETRPVRDRLRADPELVAAYVARKRQIVASGVTDSSDYCYAKAKFVQEGLLMSVFTFRVRSHATQSAH